MKALLYTVIATLFFSLPVQGAEPEQPADAIPATSETETGDTTGNPVGQSEPNTEDNGLTIPEDENFVPSVRITEDLPVAFPVDI